MLDAGLCLPAIALAQARQAGILDERKKYDFQIYPASSIEYPVSLR
jgi:hypothetical protein